MTLVDFKSNLRKLLDDESIDFKLNDISVNDTEILNSKILNGKRFLYPYPTNIYGCININDISQTFIAFNLCEFNYCCGKLILHTIRYSTKYTDFKDKMKTKDIDMNAFTKVIAMFLESSQEILKQSKYTSLSFIVSEVEQPELFNILTELGHKPVNSFNNQRMPGKNRCHEYIINLEN